MRWQGRRESENVEDRRDEGGGGGFPFPGGGGIRVGQGGGVGILGVIVIVGLALLFGVDPRIILQGGEGMPGGIQIPREAPRAPSQSAGADDEAKRFVSVVLGDTEDTWSKIFASQGVRYKPAKLVLFRDSVKSGCGFASAQMGPFYCPMNQKVYIDLAFFDMMKRRFRAPGEFAQAYVIAHEIGHHIQNLQGGLKQAQRLQAAATSEGQRNAIQVRVELQADCYAGVWAHHTAKLNNTLEPGDIESALRAAAAIGDDAIQKSTRGYAVPDSFTHGSSEQRVRWFTRGYQTGSLAACNTFNADAI
ncbi:zinc metallopeptidase [Rhodomicrobium sp. Az07]|uniref:KPN_02809 family neutral zinc metallopeptidase n=1 Tax=Rhodomicrobium sp. Az07 TaxID=2839034 RepID=UPI001BE769E9|nr:neutral zinc metallopeptidase [Rhodomicrobium sp. Az07]MBT3069577.1 zinc metallopeptidase [Rhodomicrobium sp. Az07]